MVLVAAFASAVFYFFHFPTMDDPSKLPPRKIQIALGQTVRDFMQINGLPLQVGRADTPDRNNYAVSIDVISDTAPIIFGDHWISLEAKIGQQVFELPAGRTLFLDQRAGRIYSFSFTPYDKAHPLMETNSLVKPVLDRFLAEGWKPEMANSLRFALTDDDADFKLSGNKIYAQLKDGEGNLLNVTVTNLSSEPSLPSYIIAPAPARPVHNPPVYVVRLGFYWSRRTEQSYDDLIYPRRLFVNGDTNARLRLRPWVEDPDWTPKEHGLVDTGDTREGKRWSLPHK